MRRTEVYFPYIMMRVVLLLALADVYGVLTFPTNTRTINTTLVVNSDNNEISALKDEVNALTVLVENLTHQLSNVTKQQESRIETIAKLVYNTGADDINPVSTDLIGFTAEVSARMYDVPIGRTIVYDEVYTPPGPGYDTTTGIFTCPISGIYLFAIFVEAFNTKTVALKLVIDGSSRVTAVSEPVHAGDDDTGGNILVERLNAGQRVWVETYESDNQDIYPGFTSFSGVLVQSM